jgi:VIT family
MTPHMKDTPLPTQPTHSDEVIKSFRHVLAPVERASEILFGLIMVLTLTNSLDVAQAGREGVRTMLLGALGCNVAWGIIDAVLYLMGSLADKARGLLAVRAVRETTNSETAQRLIADELPSVVTRVLEPAELEAVHQRLKQLSEPPKHAHLSKDDWRGALGVFLLVVLSTFPVAVPFIFMHNVAAARGVSNVIANVMLFLTGYRLGCATSPHPVWVGIAMLILGVLLVALNEVLGG